MVLKCVAEHGSKLTFKGKCVYCGQMQTVIVDDEQYQKWQAGTLIQLAMPTLSPAERELLISGICSECFDTI